MSFDNLGNIADASAVAESGNDKHIYQAYICGTDHQRECRSGRAD